MSQHQDLQKVALITGAGRGIGRAIAINLAKEHFNLALVGREKLALNEVAALCSEQGIQARVYVYDLSRLEGLPRLVQQVVEELGGINVLVNNAGCWIEKPIDQASLSEFDRTIDLNVRSVFALTKAVLPFIYSGAFGAVVNIGSTSAERVYGGGSMYAASKHALAGFSGSLFYDLRERGIKVSLINPGVVNTDMHAGDSRYDPERMIQPEDVAKAVSFVVNFPSTGCPTEITILPQLSPYS